MTQDLEILKEMSLPLLEEMAPYPSILADDIAKGEAFWVTFNGSMLGTHWQLKDFLNDYKIKDAERYLRQLEGLKAEYVIVLAQYYCKGGSTPAIAILLEEGDAAFAEEVEFQRDMQFAILQAGRIELRNQLELADEFADNDIADDEIVGAFDALQRDVTRNELRKQLQQHDDDDEKQVQSTPRKRKRIALPFLFLRLAAAAAVGTVATMGVITVYNNNRIDHTGSTVKPESEGANEPVGKPALLDSASIADTTAPVNIPNSAIGDSAKATTDNQYITLNGYALDTAGNEVLTNVEVILLDDKGKKRTVLSKDGKFTFSLPLHRDFEITGRKDGYHSARISLSTMDANNEDAGDVIEVILRFSKDAY